MSQNARNDQIILVEDTDMFEIWIIQQVIISLIITVVLGGFLSAIMWVAMRKKLIFEDETAIPNQLRKGIN